MLASKELFTKFSALPVMIDHKVCGPMELSAPFTGLGILRDNGSAWRQSNKVAIRLGFKNEFIKISSGVKGRESQKCGILLSFYGV